MILSNSIARTLLTGAAAFALIQPAAAQSLDDQKKQAEIEKIELDKQKIQADILNQSRATTAGNATVTAPELSAEGLMLSRHVQEQTARAIVSNLGKPGGTVSVVFGDQPMSTAEYLAVRHGAPALKANLERAAALAKDYYDKPTGYREMPRTGTFYINLINGGPALALSAVTTVASLLRVNTTVTGVALATPNEQFRSVLLQELRRYHWTVDRPRAIVASTPYADALFADMKPAKDAAARYYSKYIARLAQKDGKPANLPEGEVIVGQALATALTDHAALEKALFTPVNGVLPATVIEEQKAMADSAATRRILYIHHHKAALTSITRQGTFTGIFGVPAHVSASHVVEYALQTPDGREDKFDMVRYDTPVMRVTGVRKWLAGQAPAKATASLTASVEGAMGQPAMAAAR